MTVDEYMDTAKARCGINSDRALSLALNLRQAGTNEYRTRRAWPSDETMIRLADLAGADRDQALLDLNAWRATTAEVRSQYERIARLVKASAAVIILAMPGAMVGNGPGTGERFEGPNIYIMRLRVILAALGRALFALPDQRLVSRS